MSSASPSVKILVYACDDAYAGLTSVSAVSALTWNPGARIVLLGCRLTDRSREQIRTCVERHGGSFAFFDLTERLDAIRASGLSGYTSYAAYSRLFIAELLKDDTGRILYLDCDTLVLAPLDELFALPLDGRPFAFGYDCIHAIYKRVVRVAPDAPYYNSGVMLADLTAWRTSGATEALKAEFARPTGPNPLGDQDLIVRAWKDFITPLPPKWNFLSQYFILDYGCLRAINGREAPWASRADFEAARRQPAICHFSGHTLGRPWFTSSKHPLRARYRKAAAAAGIPEVAEQIRPMEWPYRLQYGLHRLLPNRLFQPLARLMLRLFIRRTYGV